MIIIDFKEATQNHKEKSIKKAYDEAIDIFDEAKFYSNIVFDISSKSLKRFLEIVYDLYKEKGIVKYYQNDIVIYLHSAINKCTSDKEKAITKMSLLDSLECDLYAKRTEESKNKSLVKRDECHGRKDN